MNLLMLLIFSLFGNGADTQPSPEYQKSAFELVLRYMPRLEGCYKKLIGQRQGAKGTVTSEVTISPEGKASNYKAVENTTGYTNIVNCLEPVFLDMQFPSPGKKPVTMQFPIDFSSKRN